MTKDAGKKGLSNHVSTDKALDADEEFTARVHARMRAARTMTRARALLARVGAGFAIGFLAWLAQRSATIMGFFPAHPPMLSGVFHLAALIVALLVVGAMAFLSQTMSRPGRF